MNVQVRRQGRKFSSVHEKLAIETYQLNVNTTEGIGKRKEGKGPGPAKHA